jgi:deoxyuridine 5'-triphosphate nucleotidohydrolase
MLKVQLLKDTAKLPTVAHPGDDLGFDLYAAEEVTILSNTQVKVSTGIAVEMIPMKTGFLLKDRSSMASKRVHVNGGVIDAGYRGEIIVLLENRGINGFKINVGDKIVQMIPLPTLTRQPIKQVESLEDSSRGVGGFGSSDIEVIPAGALRRT